MKKLCGLLVAFLLSHSTLAVAAPFSGRENNVGVGVGIGSIDGISFYYRYQSHAFYQNLLAFGDNHIYLDGDMCTGYLDVIPDASFLVPFWCVGAFFSNIEKGEKDFLDDTYDDSDFGPKDKDLTVVGARLPLGIQMFIPNTPLQLGLQIIPGLALSPGTDVFLHHLLSFRILF